MRAVRIHALPAMILALVLALSCGGDHRQAGVLEDGRIRVELTGTGGLAVALKSGDSLVTLATGEQPAFLLLDNGGRAMPLAVERVEPLAEGSGTNGLRARLVPSAGEQALAGVTLTAVLRLDPQRPGVLLGQVDAAGLRGEALAMIGGVRLWVLDSRADRIDPALAPHEFTLFQGAAYNWGKWYTRIKLEPTHSALNYTVKHGELQPEGGGLPLNYLWTRRGGLALAHIDTVQRVCAFPVKVCEDGMVELSLEQETAFLHPDSTGALAGLPVMIAACEGDYFEALRHYASLLEERGLRFQQSPPAAYESIWCGWGFGNKFTPADIVRSLPLVKELGIPWVVVDDGWQSGFGDWPLIPEKFPRGEADMRALVDRIHAEGLKARLWWAPTSVHPHDPLYQRHPEWIILDQQGQPEPSGWESIYLCPAYEPVVEHHRALTRRFLVDWDYDSFKMDGNCQDMVPPCYNPAHHHARPEEACEAFARLYGAIQDEARGIKGQDVVLEICECGLPPSPFKFPTYNLQVTADPTSSDQVRARIKMYRALLGRRAAPYGDHVELATGPDKGSQWRSEHGPGKDFASTVGLGGVLGTKFTSLEDDESAVRTWDNNKGLRAHWKKWVELQHRTRLFEGEYLNLYDIANDKPESHAVRKGDSLYYGLYAENYDGPVELRGLETGRRYRVVDYEDGDRELGMVTGGEGAQLTVSFTDHLLLRADPAE